MSTITVHVRTLDHKQIDLTVNKDVLVSDLKALIATRCSLPVDKQRLIFKGKVLMNDKPLSEYKVQDGDALHLVTSVHSQQSSGSASSSQAQPQQTQQQQQQPLPPHMNMHPHAQITVNAVPNVLGGELNLGQMLSSVFNSIGAAANNRGAGNQQQQQGMPRMFNLASMMQPPQVQAQQQAPAQQAQFPSPSNPVGLISDQSNALNSRTTNIMSIGDQLSRLNNLYANNSSSMQRLADLLRREPNLQLSERQEAQQLASQLSPVFTDLNALTNDLNPLLHNLQMGSQSGQAFSVSTRPTVQGVQVHIHANANEVDTIPAQLQRLSTMVNVVTPQQQQQQQVRTPQVGSITLVASQVPAVNAMQGDQVQAQQPQQQGPMDLGRMMQSVAPMVSNILGSVLNTAQQEQAQAPSQTQPSQAQQQQQQQQQPPTIASVVSNMSQRLGIQDNDTGMLDGIIRCALEHLDMGDLFGIVQGGDWQCMNKIRAPMKKHITENLLNNNASEENQLHFIEQVVEPGVEKQFKENEELIAQINACKIDTISVDEIVKGMTRIIGFYTRLLLKLILANENQNEEIYKFLPEELDRNSTFSGILRQVLDLFVGELVDNLMSYAKNGRADVESVLRVLASKLMTGLPEQFSMFNVIGSGMVVNWIMQRYQVWKNNYNVKSAKQYYEKNPRTAASAPVATSSQAAATPALDEDDILDEIYGDEDTNGKKPVASSANDDDIDFDDMDNPKPSSAAAASQAASSSQAEEFWAKNLTDEQKRLVRETIAKDKEIIRKQREQEDDDDEQGVSEAYASGSPQLKVKKPKTKAAKKETQEQPRQSEQSSEQPAPSKEVEEDDLD